MSILDRILCKRLERIREELNNYIELRTVREENQFSASITEVSPQEKKSGGVSEKFLAYMKLNDTEDEWEDEDRNEDLLKPKPLSNVQYNAPMLFPAGIHLTENKRAEKHPDIDKILEQKGETFSTKLLHLIDEKGLKDSEVYKRANIDRRLFSKIRGDVDYVPSKKTAIAFCLALQLRMDEATELLESAGYTLSTASRFDLIIMYLIEKREYNIHFANIVLDDYGEGTLSR